MKNLVILLLLLVLSFFLPNCTKDKQIISVTPVVPEVPVVPPPKNLILNPSFEKDGQCTFEGWQIWTSVAVKSSQDIPSNGGKCSIQLSYTSLWGGAPPMGGIAYAYITGISGTNAFKLKSWIKNTNSQSPGLITIGILSGYQITQEQTISAKNSASWNQYTLNCTLTSQPSDSIIVMLSHGKCPDCYYDVLFDLIELQKN